LVDEVQGEGQVLHQGRVLLHERRERQLGCTCV
jgi:hypothetical protein